MGRDAGNGITRRDALRGLAAVAAGGLLTACDSGRTTPATPSGPASGASPTAANSRNPDEALLLAALTSIVSVRSQLRGQQSRGTRWHWIASLHVMQMQTVAVLGPSETESFGVLTPAQRMTRADVIGLESQLRDDLIAAARSAHDPHISLVLAGAAAGAAQVAFQLKRTPHANQDTATALEPEPPTQADLPALQHVLANEHAALYALGVLGGRLAAHPYPSPATTEDAIAAAYAHHRQRRDDLTALVRGAGAEPTPAAAAYDVAFESLGANALDQAAQQIEQQSALGYGWLIETGASQRAWAITALIESAETLIALGDRPQAFPGSSRES